MVKKIKGYKYNTEKEASEAREKCAKFYGLPKKDSTTVYWVNYSMARMDDDILYYILADYSVLNVLGSPQEFYVYYEDQSTGITTT